MTTQSLPLRLAAPGYVPQKSWWKDLLLRALGNPNLIKRLQMPDIFTALALEPHEVALDFGCGSGYMTYEMARRCRKAYGLDVIEVADNHIPCNLEGRVEFLVSRGEGTPFADDTFDVILMSEVVPMIPDPTLFFKEVTRILKPTGRIILVNPLERRAIRKDYDRNAILVRMMRKLGRAPDNYHEFTERLQTTFGTALKQLPNEQYYRDVLDSVGYEIVDTRFTPSATAQRLYERIQFIALCFNRRTFGSHYFVLYPFMKFLDMIRPHLRGTGCVLVVCPRKSCSLNIPPIQPSNHSSEALHETKPELEFTG